MGSGLGIQGWKILCVADFRILIGIEPMFTERVTRRVRRVIRPLFFHAAHPTKKL